MKVVRLIRGSSSCAPNALTSGLALWGLAASLCAMSGCVDEDKVGCRSDGDCRGVRVCRDATCVTPEGFTDEDLAREFDFDEPDDNVNEGLVEGAGCQQGAPLSAPSLVLRGGLEAQALAAGFLGEVVALEASEDERVGAVVVDFGGGAQATVRYPRSPEDPSPLNLELTGAPEPVEVIVRYVGDVGGVGDRRLSLRRPDGALLLASCALDLAGDLPCGEADWRFTQEESSTSPCPSDPELCSPQRPSVVLSHDPLPSSSLSPGQRQRVEVGADTWLRWAQRSERLEPGCGDDGTPERPINALLMRVRR